MIWLLTAAGHTERSLWNQLRAILHWKRTPMCHRHTHCCEFKTLTYPDDAQNQQNHSWAHTKEPAASQTHKNSVHSIEGCSDRQIHHITLNPVKLARWRLIWPVQISLERKIQVLGKGHKPTPPDNNNSLYTTRSLRRFHLSITPHLHKWEIRYQWWLPFPRVIWLWFSANTGSMLIHMPMHAFWGIENTRNILLVYRCALLASGHSVPKQERVPTNVMPGDGIVPMCVCVVKAFKKHLV